MDQTRCGSYWNTLTLTRRDATRYLLRFASSTAAVFCLYATSTLLTIQRNKDVWSETEIKIMENQDYFVGIFISIKGKVTVNLFLFFSYANI